MVFAIVFKGVVGALCCTIWCCGHVCTQKSKNKERCAPSTFLFPSLHVQQARTLQHECDSHHGSKDTSAVGRFVMHDLFLLVFGTVACWRRIFYMFLQNTQKPHTNHDN